MAILKKPYEISVWEDLPEVVNGRKERKIAVIGSDQMTSPNKAFSPILTEKANGEVTFAFSMAYKYFDPAAAAEVINPFIHYLINERKVKLHYDGRWYSFLVKTHSEDSESDVWTYELTDAYVNELSKVGYNVELNAELNNNQGTITELAQKVLRYTDWQVDDSDLLQQTVREPMYICTLSGQDLTVLNIDKEQGEPDTVTIDHGDSGHEGETLYVFYSYFANKDTKYIQFMREADKDSFIYDDNGTITGKNYRVPDEITAQYVINNDIPYRIVFSNGSIITIKFNPESISLANAQMLTNQGYRKVYNQLMTYDPVMKKTVKVYNIAGDERQVYDYEESIYSTSDVVQSFISNGNNFAVYDQGSVRVSIKDKSSDNTFIQGWSKYTDRNEDETHKHTLSIVTRPEITTDNKLISSTELTGTRGFLQLNFAGTLTNNYKNTFYNSGFENNISFIDHINRGEQYALRIAAGYGSGNDIVSLTSENMVRALIAKYTIDNNGNRIIDKDGIIFNFNGTYEECPSVIKNGTFDMKGEHRASYIIDGVPEAPSVSCVYRIADSTDDYIWDSSSRWTYDSVQYTGEYVVKGSANVPFYEYYLTTAVAQQSISNDYLTNPEKNIGIFIYVNNNANLTYYISDIQITKAILDDNGEYVTIGNIPAAHVTTAHNYYIKPEIGTNAATVETFASLEDLGNEINYDYHDIIPTYNEQSEKILSITESQSNCFNILQTLCETFECWLKIDVECDENGYIVYESGTPNKTISFHEYAGDDNFAGFKYGVNLKSIQRNLNSEEIVTKLIVDNSQSDYLETGILSIRNAPTNPSGEAYILNFDYYINKGLISDGEKCQQQLNEYYKAMREYNIQLNEKQTEKQKKEMSLIKLQSNTNIYYNLINEAKEKRAQAYDSFETAIGKTYEEYVNEHTGPNAPTSTVDLMQDEEISSIVADIYESSTVINSYSSVYINTKTEYQNLKLEVEGAKDYIISVSIKNIGTRDNPQYLNKVLFDDYIPGFIFNLYNNDTLKQSNLRTSFNQKAFEYTDTVPYNKIVFTSVPDNYNSLGTHDGLHEGTTSIICTPETEYKNRYPGLQAEIDEIQTNKDACEQAFYSQYSNYIKEGTWSSNDYVDPELYYFDAVQVGNTSAFPKVEYTVDVAEVSELKGLENYNFKVGEKSYMEDTEFFGWAAYYVNKSTGIPTRIQPDDLSNYDVHKQPAKEEVIVSQVEWHLDEPENNTITIQNYKTQFEDLFQRISATVQTVQYNEATYAKTASILDSNGTINQTLLLASLNGIAGNTYMLTSDGSITIDGDCITIKNLESATNIVKIDSRGISITNNGGITWDTALDGNGLNAGLIYTGSLNTQQVVIGDKDDPSFRWDKYGISAYKQNDGQGEDRYDYRTYVRFDQYGLYGIENAADYKAASIDDVEEQAQFGITWHGFFIKNKYEDGGQVSITSDNDFQVIDGSDTERIKIGSLGIDQETGDRIYGINISNKDGESVFITNNVGDITITGKINAVGGNFSELVTVGKNSANTPYIAIDGRTTGNTLAQMYSSNYYDNPGSGWMINTEGDAVFNNITARGAIKTAVFEYAEIQAVGGVFLFRPSSTIIQVTGFSSNTLILQVENAKLFNVGSWCKLSNYTTNGDIADDPAASFNGFSHVYEITAIEGDDITLAANGSEIVQLIDKSTLVGAALVDMGNEGLTPLFTETVTTVDEELGYPPYASFNYNESGLGDLIQVTLDGTKYNCINKDHYYGAVKYDETFEQWTLDEEFTDYPFCIYWEEGSNPGSYYVEIYTVDEGEYEVSVANGRAKSNYGIGINSSDNTVALPARTIALFETEIHPESEAKITYHYKDVLGTLPELPWQNEQPQVADFYHYHMVGTQGIYTDNMYIGDKDQHVAFYTDDNGDKHLEIIGNALSIGMVTAEGVVDVINSEEYTGTTIRGDRINLSQIISIGDPTKNHIKVGDISIYKLTEDTTKVDGKQYYVYDITTGAYLDPYKVAEKTGQEIPPNVNPKEEQWYELTLQRNGIGFYGDNGFDQIAYMSADKLWIPKTVVLDEMQVGSRENTDNLGTDIPLWSWKKINAIDENTGERGTTHENLRLVWLGGDVD